MLQNSKSLIGIGLYTPAEAGRLVQINPARISRWLRGHRRGKTFYQALWSPQVDLGEDGICLGFRDLQEVRVAAAFIEKGLSPQRVRRAIELARDLTRSDHPLSSTRFRTDGRSVFLQVVEENGEERLIDLFKRQFAFREVLERSLTNVEFDDQGSPSRWWPLGRSASIVLDPLKAFGQPIEAETSIPAEVLAAAAEAEGSTSAAAKSWDVPERAVKRAVAFRREMTLRQAA